MAVVTTWAELEQSGSLEQSGLHQIEYRVAYRVGAGTKWCCIAERYNSLGKAQKAARGYRGAVIITYNAD